MSVLSRDRLPERLVVSSLALLGAALGLLYFFKASLTIYDGAGHLFAVEQATRFWPGLSGWNAYEWLGWPQGTFYPPLFYWLAAALAHLVSAETAVKLLVSAASTVLPLTIFVYARALDPRKAAVSTVAVLAIIFLAPDFLGSNLRGLFRAGLIPNFFALPFLFLFMATLHAKNRTRLASGVLFGLILLTHLVAAVVAAVYLAALLLVKLLERDWGEVLRWGAAGAIGLIIASPFWWSFFANRELFLGAENTIPSYFVPNVVAATASAALAGWFLWKRQHELSAISLLAFVLTWATAIDGNSGLLSNFHLYRFQVFGYVFLAISAGAWFSITMSHKLQLAAVAALGVALVVHGPVLAPAQITVSTTKPVGRFLETFRRSESYPAPYTFQYELMSGSPDSNWALGLFAESAANAPYLRSLKVSLRPQAYEGGTNIESTAVDPVRVPALLDLFGIDALVSLDDSPMNPIGQWEWGGKRMYFNLSELPASGLFAIPTLRLEPVTSDWDAAVNRWWLTPGPLTDLPYLGDGLTGGGSGSVEILEASSNGTHYKIKVTATERVVVLAKVSYFPNWQASVSGKRITIYRAAPSLMLFQADPGDEVSLDYR